jgi:hypothetical protein
MPKTKLPTTPKAEDDPHGYKARARRAARKLHSRAMDPSNPVAENDPHGYKLRARRLVLDAYRRGLSPHDLPAPKTEAEWREYFYRETLKILD